MTVLARTRRWIALAPVPAWGAVALALFSLGAASAPGAPTGKLAGLFAGAILIALVGYALFDYLRPLIDDLHFIEDKKRWGYKFRFGVFTIDDHDLDLIRQAMAG